MANQKISLSMVKGLSDGRVYADIDVTSHSMENEILNKSAIRQSIKNLLMFKKGERILYPEYGNGLYDSLFEGIKRKTREDIRAMITRMLDDEPRVNLVDVTVTPDIDNNQINVFVKYEIPSLSEYDTISIMVDGQLA